MALKLASLLLASATQGSADAFKQVEIPTGLSVVTNIAYELRRITVNRPVSVEVDANYFFSITRRTKTAVPDVNDADLIMADYWSVHLTTSGIFEQQRIHIWEPAGQVVVVEDPLFLQVDSDTTSAANVWSCRIEYDVVKITENERLTLLSRSLLTSVS